MIYTIIDDLPTADVVEVKHGYWIRLSEPPAKQHGYYHCPICGAKIDGDSNTPTNKLVLHMQDRNKFVVPEYADGWNDLIDIIKKASVRRESIIVDDKCNK